MKIVLASCNMKLIKKYCKTGIFAGVITNPNVVAEEKRNPIQLCREIIEVVPYMYYQLQAGSTAKMLQEAHEFLEINSQKVRIKVPTTFSGFEVISSLVKEGVYVMATCVPTAAWMIFAAESGAKAVSPYSGMLQRKGLCSRRDEIIRMQKIIDAQNYDIEICTGIYDVTDIPFYACNGIKSCFIWGKDVETYLTQPLVQEAVDSFSASYNQISSFY